MQEARFIELLNDSQEKTRTHIDDVAKEERKHIDKGLKDVNDRMTGVEKEFQYARGLNIGMKEQIKKVQQDSDDHKKEKHDTKKNLAWAGGIVVTLFGVLKGLDWFLERLGG
ncbi:hypothetical protein N9937_00595 [bacterium]|nr:hypothetical protein [bacterium]